FNIYVNDEETANEIRSYISTISPDQEKIVHYYKGSEPIFDHFEVNRQIKSAFGRVVSIHQGAYLVIEHTEALHVIDVNSGIRNRNRDQEDNAFEVNKHAAEEIARQMRLRDMGGIVIVDFIDMEEAEHRNELYKYMQTLMANDRAKHTVLPLTKFGLMQITRQRVRPVTEIETMEVCPTCGGSGKIAPTLVIDEALERQLAFYVKEKDIKKFKLKTSPILEAYLTKGLWKSFRSRWQKKYSCKIEIVKDSDYTILQSTWYDAATGEMLSSSSR
ncbi:MAG: ribonuclease E/G, partial [Bacteroidales bacterium]|nr:ribonuclease E/G [Bacteroidales bacterium]